MANYLKFRNIIPLGFMTFALFVGAGNIIFPPMIGLQSGEKVWIAAIGFLITAVGLPVIAIIALAKVEGSIEKLSAPIGKTVSTLLATICYLTIGPLFAIPRTAIVSYEIGIQPLISNKIFSLFLYSLIYFIIVTLISLYPNKLLNTIGNFLAPLKIISLVVLAITAVIYPAGPTSHALDIYKISPFSSGFINGYLTMDTLSAMVLGIIITNAARSRGIKEKHLLTRYIFWSSVITCIGLTILYLSLFYLGANSSILVNQSANGTTILHAYVQYIFGNAGVFLLTMLIFLVCLVTAIGLTSACAEFFSYKLSHSYRQIIFIVSIFSIIMSNLGLQYLIQISLPILIIIYPPCTVLILSSFIKSRKKYFIRIIVPTMITSFIFGMIDGIKVSIFNKILPIGIKYLPFSEQGLSWIIPTFIVLILMIVWNRNLKD